MASLHKALLRVQSPVLLAKRYRGKINIQKPRPPHFEKQLLIDFTQPVFRTPAKTQPEYALCDKNVTKFAKKDIDNPFERILANECLGWFNTSKMVIFLHMNSMKMEDQEAIYAKLKKNNMTLRKYGKKIVSMATTGTRYEAVNSLFVSQQNILFGQPEEINKLFKMLKKAPQMIVMAGIIHDRMMSKNELVEFSKLSSLEMARSQLCAVLQSAGSCIVNQLQQSQLTLVCHLDKHVELQTLKPTSGTAPTEPKE